MKLASSVAVVVHPHPSMGGDSSHPFVQEVAAALSAAGVVTVTPDLAHPDPVAAAGAVTELANTIRVRHTAAHVVLVGYSWGSIVVSHAAPEGLGAMVLVAPPSSMALGNAESAAPLLALVPQNDQYGGVDETKNALAGRPLTAVEVVPGADHFLWGSIAPIAARVVGWIREQAT